MVSIIVLALVKSKPFSEKHSRICKITGITVYVLFSKFALTFHYNGIYSGSFIIITLSSVSIMILIEILKDWGEKRCSKKRLQRL